jgi:hypothetical protein
MMANRLAVVDPESQRVFAPVVEGLKNTFGDKLLIDSSQLTRK